MNYKLKHKSVVFISDLRNIPLLSALSIYYRLKLHGCDVELWIGESKKTGSYDYGDHLITKRARIVRFWLVKIFGAKVINDKPTINEYPLTGVVSSLISLTNDHLASENKYPKLYHDLITTHSDACSVAEKLLTENVSHLYVYNGRKASVYAATLTAKRNNIQLYFYEYGSNSRDYSLREFSPHDYEQKSKELLNYYLNDNTPKSVRRKIGVEEIEKKLSNHFTINYIEESLKEYGVVIFLASPHEYYALDDTICNSSIPSCEELLERASNIIQELSNKSIAVKSHPNMQNDPSKKEWDEHIVRLKDKGYNFDYYDSDSDISSYSLINNSDYLITDYSSIAIDAIYLGKDLEKIIPYSINWYYDILNYITGMKLSSEEMKIELAYASSLMKKPSTYKLPLFFVRLFEVLRKIGL